MLPYFLSTLYHDKLEGTQVAERSEPFRQLVRPGDNEGISKAFAHRYTQVLPSQKCRDTGRNAGI